jgi:hypothetical protein
MIFIESMMLPSSEHTYPKIIIPNLDPNSEIGGNQIQILCHHDAKN